MSAEQRHRIVLAFCELCEVAIDADVQISGNISNYESSILK